MSVRTLRVGLAALAALTYAAPAAAQQRGTIEFGGFGSTARFDNALSLKTAFGGGGRVGAYLDPRWSLEFEQAEMRATRPNGLRDVNVGVLSGRVVYTPITAGRLSLLVGAGAGVSTETNFMHSYGVDALAGFKIGVRDNVALRVDGVMDWLANEEWKTYQSVRVGLSVYRRPAGRTMTNTIAMEPSRPAPMTMVHADSVSAGETRRLRGRDAALDALRDSLRNAPSRPVTTAANMESMEASINFKFDKSDLTDSARMVLDDKIRVFRANSTMTIVIVGYTDLTGSDAYNMALGTRRAEAAKAYIVARGIAEQRVVIESKGMRQPLTQAAGEEGQAPNRRARFRLLMTPSVIAKP